MAIKMRHYADAPTNKHSSDARMFFDSTGVLNTVNEDDVQTPITGLASGVFLIASADFTTTSAWTAFSMSIETESESGQSWLTLADDDQTITLSDGTYIAYMCSSLYDTGSTNGIRLQSTDDSLSYEIENITLGNGNQGTSFIHIDAFILSEQKSFYLQGYKGQNRTWGGTNFATNDNYAQLVLIRK